MTPTLTELQRIPTSGARAVEAFSVDGLDLLAVPQLAVDVPNGPVGMNAGDSDTDLLILRRVDGRYVPHATVPAPGGEDAEFFTIEDRSFLAVASIRSGAGPYRYTVDSTILEWRGGSFSTFQAVTTYAAKQWKHWQINDRHFLGLAQGVDLPHLKGPNRDSVVYEWDGSSFAQFQAVHSSWAYNWHPFEIDGEFLVAHADHLQPSLLYRWNGNRLVAHQSLVERAGRAFAHFVGDGQHHLLVAGLAEPPCLMRWSGGRFVPFQTLSGLGAREVRVVELSGRLFVIRVNFILGTPRDPEPSLSSQIYEWQDGRLIVVAEFPTSGGTDVEIVANDESGVEFVVSNSLSGTVRFATDSVLYTFSSSGRAEAAS